jgi:hypothetical protein
MLGRWGMGGKVSPHSSPAPQGRWQHAVLTEGPPLQAAEFAELFTAVCAAAPPPLATRAVPLP